MVYSVSAREERFRYWADFQYESAGWRYNEGPHRERRSPTTARGVEALTGKVEASRHSESVIRLNLIINIYN